MLTLGALALSSCVKENDSYKDLLPVQPGMNIYNCAATQNRVAMQAANAGMRVAILAAEVAKQRAAGDEEVTVETVKSSNNVLIYKTLFNSSTTIETVEEGYMLTFNKNYPMPDYFYLEGSLLIRTNGASELTEGAVWNVEMQDDFKLYSYSSYGGSESQVNMEGGTTTITASAGGSCTIRIANIAASIENGKSGASNWSGSFVVRPADESVTLAYSSCKGKTFDVEGSAAGASLYANI